MVLIYALLLIDFRFLCFLLLLFCSFLTACFSVKLMNISVESFSWLFHGNCCRRCSLPGSARLLLSGSKERPSVGGRWSWRNWCPVGSWQGERQQEVTRPKWHHPSPDISPYTRLSTGRELACDTTTRESLQITSPFVTWVRLFVTNRTQRAKRVELAI